MNSKETIELVRKMVEDGTITQEVAVKYCPELKENEGERIRKEIISAINIYCSEYNRGTKVRKEMLAWLENQGEHANFLNKIQIGDKVTRNQDGMLVNLSQLNRVAKKDENQEYADKVEPKFKVGNWYLCVKDFYGKGVRFDKGRVYYCKLNGCLQEFDSGAHIAIVEELYEYFKLWTIEEAKAGDVLTDGNLPFIFKKIDTNRYSYAYCGISVDDGFKIESDGESGEWTRMQDIKPATKEQRDLLFKKMHEARYEWDAEHKQLKRIEGESAWSEEDEINLREALHHIRMYNLANKADILDEWLRSLKDRLQPRQEELSDEDKENLGLIIEALKSCTNDPDTYSKQIEWLENKVK